jgi:hypothetical protein
MRTVKILKKCVVNEFRNTQHLSWWIAQPGDLVDIGFGVNGFRREIESYDGPSLDELDYDFKRYRRVMKGVYEELSNTQGTE